MKSIQTIIALMLVFVLLINSVLFSYGLITSLNKESSDKSIVDFDFYQMEINSDFKVKFTSPFYLGENFSKLDLEIATNNKESLVSCSKICKDCETRAYNPYGK